MSNYSGYYVLDAEGNGLDKGHGVLPEDVTEVHCVVFKDIPTGEKFHFDKFTGWDGFREEIANAKMLVCHNILDYDLPVFERLLDARPNDSCIVVDTLVWSRALYPDRKFEGGHGLGPWGKRNGLPKPPMEDWTTYCPEMLERCESDVENNWLTFQKLSQEASMYESGTFLWLEQQVAKIISDQSKRGHAFDKQLAESLAANLSEWLNQIDVNLARFMHPKPKMHNKPVKQIIKKNGDYSQYVYEWYEEEFKRQREAGPVQPHKAFEVCAGLCTEEEPEAFCRVVWPSPNFGSNDQMIQHMLDMGFQPTEFTDKGNPQITEEAFNIEENRHLKVIGLQICKRRQIASRFSMVEGWLEALDADGRIRGEVNPQGAVTLRMTHKVVVNVPKYDREERWSQFYRACFCSSPINEGEKDYGLEWEYERPTFKFEQVPADGELLHTTPGAAVKTEEKMIYETVKVTNRMAMVGCDADGLENRLIAHYLNNPELSEKIIQDFHTLLWQSVEYYLKSRNTTKNWEYAYFFGAADLKLGTMLDHIDPVTEEEASLLGWWQLQRGKNVGMWKCEGSKPLPWNLVKYAINGGRSRDMMEKEIPEMGELVEEVQEEIQQGYMTLFDGRRLIARRSYSGEVLKHTALNLRIQGAGALIMKTAQVILKRWLGMEGIPAYFLNTVHDEFQLECYPSDRFRVARLAEESIRWAGRHYNLNIDLDATAKIGINWAETH